MLIDSIFARLIRQGRLTLRHPDGTRRVIGGSAPGPEAALAINTPEIAKKIATPNRPNRPSKMSRKLPSPRRRLR